MWVIIVIYAIMANACDQNLNDAKDFLNPGCNLAGVCWDWPPNGVVACQCCDSTSDNDIFCQNKVPGKWRGSTCSQATHWTQVTWGYLFEGDGVTCADDSESLAVPNMLNETILLVEDYDGEILALPCEICTVDSPCEFFEEGETADSGIFVKFGTDLNTYYDLGCGQGDLPGTNYRKCSANWDFGISASVKMENVLDAANDYKRVFEELPGILGLGSGEFTNTALERVFHKDVQIIDTVVQSTRLPTPTPTVQPSSSAPTKQPTRMPTDILAVEDLPCEKYVNKVADLHFMSAGSSCRGNINESWTGGKTCDSPYIICLPGENTPAIDIMNRTYKSNTHRYTVKECLQECSYDQRCLGVEFVADENTTVGDCNLIDDIPVKVVNPDYDFDYTEDSGTFTNTNLDNSVTGGDALCWEKANYCNPYFESEDLSNVMLNCYCPNNRKGFYTKKVQRTVENTRFCDNDSIVEERIRKAQANRMFHLCENWCLFDTLNPEQESWYWDPWKKCWRETYSGVGPHRAYCDRVIRNPDSIELKFVNHRSQNFLSCNGTRTPTSAPVEDSNTTWVLSEKAESCDEACSRQGNECAADQTAQVFASESQLINAFSEADFTCEFDDVVMNRTDYEGWALPGVMGSRVCANRQPTLSHLEDLDSDCGRVLGSNWQRLCACF